MPVRIIVNRSRKLSKDYNSEAYGLSIDTEYAGDVTADPGAFAQQVNGLFNLVDKLLDDKVQQARSESPRTSNHQQARGAHTQPDSGRRFPGSGARANGNSGANIRNGNGHDAGHRRLTQAQEKAIGSMARRLDQDANDWADREFNVDGVKNLTVKQASQLIDILKQELEAQQAEGAAQNMSSR
jgi:hypothetical protein